MQRFETCELSLGAAYGDDLGLFGFAPFTRRSCQLPRYDVLDFVDPEDISVPIGLLSDVDIALRSLDAHMNFPSEMKN